MEPACLEMVVHHPAAFEAEFVIRSGDEHYWYLPGVQLVHVMTGGGPGYATTTLVQLIYNTAFRDFNFGFASAQALFLFVIIATISLLQFKFLSTDVEY